jgi:hypothetical protein
MRLIVAVLRRSLSYQTAQAEFNADIALVHIGHLPPAVGYVDPRVASP